MDVRESVVLPVDTHTAWTLLSDASRMVTLDPLLVDFQPENGTVEEGTLNRVTARIGPFRTTSTSRTTVLDPPHRAVFESVEPSRPVRILTEDRLEELDGACRYVVTISVTPTTFVGNIVAPLIARTLGRSRRRLMRRLRAVLDPGTSG